MADKREIIMAKPTIEEFVNALVQFLNSKVAQDELPTGEDYNFDFEQDDGQLLIQLRIDESAFVIEGDNHVTKGY